VSASSPGIGVPAGTVVFYSAGTRMFDFNLVDGKAVIKGNVLVGMQTLTAVYQGDSGFKTSTSPVVHYSVSEQPRFEVNTYKLGTQTWPSVAGLAGGGSVVTWQSEHDVGGTFGIYGRLYDRAGKALGGQFAVNTYGTNHQAVPSVAGLADGGFVVTWESRYQDGSGYGIYGQRYGANGQRVGGEFRANTTTAGSQQWPTVTGLPDGGFVVVWMSEYVSTDQVKARLFGANGMPTSKEITIGTTRLNGYAEAVPKVAALSNGGFVVVWVDDKVHTTALARRYDSSGGPVGAIIAVGPVMTSPNVVPMKDGGFVVTWNIFALTSGHYLPQSVGQRYSATGARIAARFRINTTSGSSYPKTAAVSDGGFVVTWSVSSPNAPLCPSTEGIFGQRYNRFGQKRGAEFKVQGPLNQYAEKPAVAGLAQGGFVVVWTDAEDGFSDLNGIFRRQYAN
jgi:hypothetical protein